MELNVKRQQQNIEKLVGNCIDDYTIFLKQVENDTLEVFRATDLENLHEDISWDIEGVEFRLNFVDNENSVYRNYGEQVLHQAFEEVPSSGLKDNSNWRYKRDFQSASRKLGCLVHPRVSASPILDLGFLICLFAQYDIPCYIDYEACVFHINAMESVKEIKSENKHLEKVNQ